MRLRARVAASSAALIVILAACSSGATQSPTAQGTTEPSVPVATEAPTAAPSAAVTPVATISNDSLVVPGHLTVCSDIPYPPLEYLDAEGNPIGSDMEIAAGLAQRLGLTLQVENTVFDYIIAAVNGDKCDIIISDQNMTDDRIAQVDMLPYLQAGQAFAVLKGNPQGFQTELDVCGKKVGAETATTEIQYLEGTDLYKKSGGLKKSCADAGKPAPIAVPFEKDPDAFLALAANTVDIYFADLPVVAYYVGQQPDQFEQAPIPQLAPIKVGISIPKGHTEVANGIKAALLAMMADGSYVQILTTYNVQAGALTPADVVMNKH
jgi:polar amino acid transport system substrate-binding protein